MRPIFVTRSVKLLKQLGKVACIALFLPLLLTGCVIGFAWCLIEAGFQRGMEMAEEFLEP
jgi:hypothetical protein